MFHKGVSKPTAVIGAVLGAGLFVPSVAQAHVKWFCAYSVAGQPDGLSTVLCGDFEKLLLLGIGTLLFGVLVELTFVGDNILRALDRLTSAFKESDDVIIRACCGFFLVSAWCVGGVILTPELKTTSTMIPWFQLFLAACLVSRKTTIVTALGIVVLFVTAITHYGMFHLADYPVFLGAAAYLGAVSLGKTIFGFRPIDVLRWTAAVTLMWASVEKWAYPEWTYPLFVNHPKMAMGFDTDFYMRAAGVVEFTLSFALLWTPLVRRIAAIMLTATFITAIFEFGKIDAIGHAPIIGVLIAFVIDPVEKKATVRQAALMPIEYCGALVASLGLYYVGHAAIYGTTIL